MKKQSRLKFTDDEKAIPKVDKVDEQVKKDKVLKKDKKLHNSTGKVKTNLIFEEIDKKKSPSKLKYTNKMAIPKIIIRKSQKEISENKDDNIAVNSVYSVAKSSTFIARHTSNIYRHYKKLSYKKNRLNTPQSNSNPISKVLQKKAIKKNYLTTRHKKGISAIQKITTKTLKKSIASATKYMATVIKNPKVLIILLAIILIASVVLTMVSSISVMFQGAISNIVSTSYTSEDEELIKANDNYTELENKLQKQINNIEKDYPSYDEYRYNLDSIAHDPHQLAAYLTTLTPYFTASYVDGKLQEIFNLQYELTLTRVVETRYRTETRTGSYTDSNGNSHSYTYTVEVPYDYYILEVELINHSIDSVVKPLLSEEQLKMYNVYRQTLGNKPLLFGGGSLDDTQSVNLNNINFINGTRTGNINITNAALSQVGNIGGKPYWSWYGFNSRVEWCAVFVSWVLNQAGYTEPKFSSVQNQGVPYFLSNDKWKDKNYRDIATGDVIFFDWESDGRADHVGIVVGRDNKRIYTIEGNSGNACKIRDYDLDSSVIMGYGLMN